MAYNPALPADLTKATAAEMRSQFHGVVDMIQAAPAGPPGPPGPQGDPGAVASVTGGVVDDTDPANPVILTDVAGGVPKLVGAPNLFRNADASASTFTYIGGAAVGTVGLTDGDAATSSADPSPGIGSTVSVDL